MSCELLPGTRLKVMDLAATASVSPGAVREALSRLTTEHLVISLNQRGFRVSNLSRDDMADLLQTKATLESDLVYRSIVTREPDWLASLKTAYESLSAQGSRPPVDDSLSISHRTFHRALVAGCGSPWSLRLFDTLYAASERYRNFAHRFLASGRHPALEHEALFAAAANGEANRARQLIFEHTMLTRHLLDAGLLRLETTNLPG